MVSAPSIIASMNRAMNAGPLPERAVTASICFSGSVITLPMDISMSLTTDIELSEKHSHRDMTDIPSCTRAGVFGMTLINFPVFNFAER